MRAFHIYLFIYPFIHFILTLQSAESVILFTKHVRSAVTLEREAFSLSAQTHANTLRASESDGGTEVRKRTCSTGAELTAVRASGGRTRTHTRTHSREHAQRYAPALDVISDAGSP